MKQTNSQPWLHGRVPNGYWDLRENRVGYMHWLASTLGYTKPADWYRVGKKDFQKHYGGGLLNSQFRDSIADAVRDFRPDFEWIPWMFVRTPRGYWDSLENRAEYLRWLEQRLGMKSPHDWYSVTKNTFAQHHGRGLLRIAYGDSVSTAALELYPEFNWQQWLFAESPQKFWRNKENRLRYLRWLGSRLGYESPEDWYAVTQARFSENKGRGLLATYFNDSPQEAVRELYPDTELQPWRFTSVKQRHWQSASNRREYLLWLGQTLGFRADHDWQRLTADAFRRNHGAGLMAFYRSRQIYDERVARARPDALQAGSIWNDVRDVESALSGDSWQEILREITVERHWAPRNGNVPTSGLAR